MAVLDQQPVTKENKLVQREKENKLVQREKENKLVQREKDLGGQHKVARLHMELPPKSMERLEYLRKITEATSNVEVVRDAIRLYEALVVEIEKGSRLMLRDKEGREKDLCALY